jgi:hypothetical protein
MNQALLTTIQEVYFDLVDARDNQLLALAPDAELPQEFDTIGDWLDEQINKLERIEQLTKGNT